MAHTRDGAARVMEHEQGGTIILCGETGSLPFRGGTGGGVKYLCFVIMTPTEYRTAVPYTAEMSRFQVRYASWRVRHHRNRMITTTLPEVT